MTLGIAFWIVMLLWLVLSGCNLWRPGTCPAVCTHGLLFLLFVLVGWQVFEAPLHK